MVDSSWHNMFDIATKNVFKIFKALQPNYMRGVTHARRLLIKELTKQLVIHFLRKRHATPPLQKSIRCGLTFHNADPVQQQQTSASKRKDIIFVRMQNIEKCDATAQCHKAVCSKHSVSLVTCWKCGGNAQMPCCYFTFK